MKTEDAKVSTSIAVLLNKMENVEADVKDIKQKLDSEYATKEWCSSQFGQTKKQVEQIGGLIITAVVLALLALIIKK